MLKVIDLYKKHIKGTSKGDLAPDVVGLVCNLERPIRKKLKLKSSNVYIKARALKHIYERIYLDANKPDEFTLVLQRMPKVVGLPKKICKNKGGRKRGEFCFLRDFDGEVYLCTLEIIKGELFVVTSFIPGKESYYSNLEVLLEF